MSALVHERTLLLCALGGAAAGEKHSVCQSDGSPGLGERGEESGEGDRYVPTRHESRPAPRSQVCFCVRKEKLNDSPVPRGLRKYEGFPRDADTDTVPRLRDCERNWALLAAIGRIVIRHEQVARFFFTSEGGNELVFVTHRTSRVLWNGPRNSF